MANTTTSERWWNLDTVAEIKGVGVPTIVRKIVFLPTTKDHAATIQEYDSTGTLRTAIYIRAGNTDASPVSLDFGVNGRLLNGFKLSAISAGSIDVYLGKD